MGSCTTQCKYGLGYCHRRATIRRSLRSVSVSGTIERSPMTKRGSLKMGRSSSITRIERMLWSKLWLSLPAPIGAIQSGSIAHRYMVGISTRAAVLSLRYPWTIAEQNDALSRRSFASSANSSGLSLVRRAIVSKSVFSSRVDPP